MWNHDCAPEVLARGRSVLPFLRIVLGAGLGYGRVVLGLECHDPRNQIRDGHLYSRRSTSTVTVLMADGRTACDGVRGSR